MGLLNLTLPSGSPLDITKAIVAVWFRVPSAVATALKSGTGAAAGTSATSGAIAPLICFGPQQTITVPELTFPDYTDALCTPNPYNPSSNFFDGVTSSYLGGPSYIGIIYNSSLPNGGLVCNIQTGNDPTLVGQYFGETDVVCNHTTGQWSSTFVDQSSAYETVADSYFGFGAAPVTPDQIHLLLLSWDLSNGCSSHGSPSGGPDENFIDSVSKMYMSLDDVAKTGNDLPATWANRVSDIQGWGPNDIVSRCVGALANGNADPTVGMTASLATSSIPIGSVAIPGPASITPSPSRSLAIPRNLLDDGNTYLLPTPGSQIEFGPLRVWLGQSADVGSETVRRLFVDAEGKPVASATAEAAFGAPAIKLAGAANWQNGTNQGTAGNFTKTGTINGYSATLGL
jgi:hypothetical protein